MKTIVSALVALSVLAGIAGPSPPPKTPRPSSSSRIAPTTKPVSQSTSQTNPTPGEQP